jgi:hypothetical protein
MLPPSGAAALIDRFIVGKQRYPQEWNDFVEGAKVEPEVEPFRRRCSELDPLINRPGHPDEEALSELKGISKMLADLSSR